MTAAKLARDLRAAFVEGDPVRYSELAARVLAENEGIVPLLRDETLACLASIEKKQVCSTRRVCPCVCFMGERRLAAAAVRCRPSDEAVD